MKKLILVTRKKLDLLNHDKVYKFIKHSSFFKINKFKLEKI